MMAALARLPARAVVLLHASCHNPTGADLSPAQWRELLELLKRRQLLPDRKSTCLNSSHSQISYAVFCLKKKKKKKKKITKIKKKKNKTIKKKVKERRTNH